MFTGLIQNLGRLEGRRSIPGGELLRIRHGFKEPLAEGASVAVNGVCLTVTEDRNAVFSAECYYETIRKTALPFLKTGDPINLEPALAVNGILEGHLVQGHVSAVVRVVQAVKKGRGLKLTVSLPENRKGLIQEGSVALDGVSLTIASLGADRLSVQLIGETLERTTLQFRKPGDPVNLESDLLLRGQQEQIEQKKETLTMGRLAQWGYV